MGVTAEDVLREWRKTIGPGTQVRHKDGAFGEVIGKTQHPMYDLDVKFDGEIPSPTYRRNLFPSWWPEEEWPWLKTKPERPQGGAV